MPDDIVDRIYEAAFVPELWRSVLDVLVEHSKSASAGMMVFRQSPVPQIVATEFIEPALRNFTAKNGWQKTQAVHHVLDIPPAAFIFDADYYPPEILATNTLRIEAIHGLGIGGQIGTAIPMPTKENVLLTFDRWLRHERPTETELAFLNSMRPHLARAGLIAARLGVERARGAVEIMEQLGLPAAVLTGRGRLVASNALLERANDIFVSHPSRAIALTDVEANMLLQTAIDEILADTNAAVRSIPVRATETRPATVVHVLPLRRAAHDVFSGGDVIIAATEIRLHDPGPPVSLLMGLFDLTPAEARIASSLAAGKTLQESAKNQSIQVTTARSYLEGIFRKTGTHRQSELVALLRGMHAL